MQVLTNQENLCLQWSAAGKTSAEISDIMQISYRTVDFHINNACSKLGARGRQMAVAMAMQYGLLPEISNLLPSLPTQQNLHR